MPRERDEGHVSLVMLAAAQTRRPFDELLCLPDEELYLLITLPEHLDPLESGGELLGADGKRQPHRRNTRNSHWP